MTNKEKRILAETYLGEINWTNDTEGYCECPGKEKHTTPNGPKDCIIYLDKVPTVYCFHQSCQNDVDEYSAPLRKLIPIEQENNKPFNKAKWKKELKRSAEISALANITKKRLLAEPLPDKKILVQTLSPRESREHFFSLFGKEDILWIGETNHSNWCGRGHFLPRSEWESRRNILWSYTCTGTFKPTHHFRRSLLNILDQKYKAIEFDYLDPEPIVNQLLGLNFFQDLVNTYDLMTRMVVDTGNKSLHFWVDNNPKIFNKEFELFLKILGADVRTLQPSQPVRFPGVVRKETGKQQTVIVL
jgi:hypothetical protein